MLHGLGAALNWVEQTPLAVTIARSNWLFPAIETVHVIALTLTIGTVLILDLRLLGLASVAQTQDTLRREVLPWTWGAFAAAVLSGALMFVSQASGYAANGAFRFKMMLILLAGINVLVFETVIARDTGVWERAIPARAKCAAGLSLVLWIAVVFFGRRVGFTMTPE
jgi:hypothetical protein